jgi:hypothetical protein
MRQAPGSSGEVMQDQLFQYYFQSFIKIKQLNNHKAAKILGLHYSRTLIEIAVAGT